MPFNFSYKSDTPTEKPHPVNVDADKAMAHLEAAAQAGDEQAFLAVQKAIVWERRPPHDYIRAIQGALSVGAHLMARRLSTQGADRHWLKSHRDAFRGQWVALRDGQLLGSAASLQRLTADLDETKDILLTRSSLNTEHHTL